MNDNNKEIEEATKALESTKDSETYINESACSQMTQSFISEFQWLLIMSMLTIFLKHVEEPKAFLDKIKNQWKNRVDTLSNNDYKRFQKIILESVKGNGLVLDDTTKKVLEDYVNTITKALNQSEKFVDETIETVTKNKKGK